MSTDFITSLVDILKIDLTNNIPTIIFAIIILILGIISSKHLRKASIKFLNRFNVDQSIANYTSYSIYIIGLVLTAMLSLSIIGVPQSAIISVIGVIGVGLGIAFNETLSNLGSGYVLLFFKPFKIDDYIEFNGIEGTVIDMHIFNTTLKTFDNKTIVIPNSKIANQSIINYTKQDKRRVDIRFNLPYGTDMDSVNKILNGILTSEKRILKDPEYLIGVSNFNDSGMEIAFRVWVNTEDYWGVFYSLMSKVEKTFRENNIDMSIPQKIIYSKKK